MHRIVVGRTGKDLRTVFERESQDEIERRKKQSYEKLNIENRNKVSCERERRERREKGEGRGEKRV